MQRHFNVICARVGLYAREQGVCMYLCVCVCVCVCLYRFASGITSLRRKWKKSRYKLNTNEKTEAIVLDRRV